MKYEQKRLAFPIVEANLMIEQGSADARISEMHKELAEAQYQVSMGEDKVQ